MPLFMDYHQFEGITVEEVKKAHIADLSVQHKYGVTYHQFWVNEKAGSVFCLMEGPDMHACEMVHREAHGIVACAIVEVEAGFYELVMGKGHVIDTGHVLHPDGSVDPGIRFFISVCFPQFLVRENDAKERWRQISSAVSMCHGRRADTSGDETVLFVFNSAVNAVQCAVQIHAFGSQAGVERGCRIALAAGNPVTVTGEFFKETLKLATRINTIAPQDQILFSALAAELCRNEMSNYPGEFFRFLDPSDEEFVSVLFEAVEKKLSHENFTIDQLCMDIGISRPQLYRKTVALTGLSPNELIRHLRMKKAMTLLRKRSLNIAQVAMEVGYNNPSYFSKCFAGTFGRKPSEISDNVLSYHGF